MSRFLTLILLVVLMSGFLYAGDEATPLQVLYCSTKIFPNAKQFAIFVESNQLDDYTTKIARATVQTKCKAQIFPIKNATDIGKYIKSLENGTHLIIFNSPVFEQSSSKLYILSKCKEKQIAVISTSEDYSNSGAVVGIYRGADGKLQTIVNLKHSKYLEAQFTDDFVAQAGITAVMK